MSSEPIHIAFMGFWHPETEEAVRQGNPLWRMLSRHFDLRLDGDPDFVVYSGFGDEYLGQ